MEELQGVKMITEMIWNDLGKQDKKGLIESLEKDMELQKERGQDELAKGTEQYITELKHRFNKIYN
jgi:hypothetical protein|nr:MAG TPA_asm: hypothetical protein [Caudoviricetes sp.]